MNHADRPENPDRQLAVPAHQQTYAGQRWLVEERDACGVGFIASPAGQPTHRLLEQTLTALTCMEHRGGCSADRDSGDGAGILTAVPWQLLQDWGQSQNIDLSETANLAVGMVFLPQAAHQLQVAKQVIADILRQENLQLRGWRVVPVKPAVLGAQAREHQPYIEQLIVAGELTGDEWERQLYLVRRKIVKALQADGRVKPGDDFYICSLSGRTIVYKGMVRSAVLGQFYTDLTNPLFVSNFAVYHRRFSTNTMPKWPLAQPMRMLGHNGEINTLLGNINWMTAREKDLDHPVWNGRLKELQPILNLDNSDSGTLDNVLELMVRSGRSPIEGLMIMVPEAYKNQPDLEPYPEITDFYNYYNGLQEAWDGPALLAFSDGKLVGASLDRNGLRPARYCITKDGYIVVGSEAGVVDLPIEIIAEKGRLGPGQSIVVNLETHEVLHNWEVKQRVARSLPYGTWLQQHGNQLAAQPFQTERQVAGEQLIQQQSAFGYTAEDVEMIINDMAENGKEPTFCMGDDTPLAVLSSKAHPLYDYFKQRFAQVTNPAIDPLREKLVMSLEMVLGKKGNLLEAQPEFASQLRLSSPVLNEAELEEIKLSPLGTAFLSTIYPVGADLSTAAHQLCAAAVTAVQAGHQIIILSDWLEGGLSADHTYLPPLLAVGAVHHHLIQQGLRSQVSLVVDTAQCWSTHHFACLIGYGASAVCPYLAWESVRNWWHSTKVQNAIERQETTITITQAQANYRKAAADGLLKVMSKMGISLLSSYHGAQIFEVIGMGGDLLQLAFRGTTSRIGGLTIADLAQETLIFHHRAFPAATKKLENLGFFNYRPSGEYHMNSPQLAKALHKAVDAYQTQAGYDHYETYKQHLRDRPVTALRDLLDFQGDQPAIDLAEVESVQDIVKRFCTGGMSLGALSREAHEVLAIAMNRLGAKSNSGEGGEDPVRYKVMNDVQDGKSAVLPHLKGLRNGDTALSAIKQIASGRFGVTPEYLMSAQQLEIKLAQGAKPGEGGQLPGKKVSPYIAMLRRSKPGVTLISPPPHHDIYSIEDLEQLIYDLHQINPQARVSVKLVAEIGIGTIAAGVAKANADVIQISGHDGGTGASPLSSIKHAGSPWELGLTEVHRVLMENKLRDRVLLRVDGGLKSGWDVIIAALMGAEEYGFGSIAMIAEGCIMARICHTNSCPVGVASQREDLRKRFPGLPAQVVNFFYFIAEEVRQLLAKLGYRSLHDIVGRADLLHYNPAAQLTKVQALNLDCLTKLPDTKIDRSFLVHGDVHANGEVLDDQILANPAIQTAIQHQGVASQTWAIVNTDRSVGTRVSGAIAQKYGDSGFAGQLTLNFHGAAGQSFGAFNHEGVSLILTGESNDYVGKGMNGGEIIIKPTAGVGYDRAKNVIIGNTCLYGGTGGFLFANGTAGERFAVRNSRTTAVVEGTGDHCCEYMTGGVVVVLGSVGRNVGAGMTGGLGYFLDEDHRLIAKINPESVKWQRVTSVAGIHQLRQLIEAHAQKTGSPKAQAILANFSTYLPQFWQLVPPSEADTPEARGQNLSAGESPELVGGSTI
jgi:glutamate synthase (ferredoxin)